MFRVFILADPIPNKNIIAAFFRYIHFLNYLFIFRFLDDL